MKQPILVLFGLEEIEIYPISYYFTDSIPVFICTKKKIESIYSVFTVPTCLSGIDNIPITLNG
jgi:hypothetical protein